MSDSQFSFNLHFVYPSGKPIIPHLRRCQGLGVVYYSLTLDALYLGHPRFRSIKVRLREITSKIAKFEVMPYYFFVRNLQVCSTTLCYVSSLAQVSESGVVSVWTLTGGPQFLKSMPSSGWICPKRYRYLSASPAKRSRVGYAIAFQKGRIWTDWFVHR